MASRVLDVDLEVPRDAIRTTQSIEDVWRHAVEKSVIGTYIWADGIQHSEHLVSRFAFCDFYEIMNVFITSQLEHQSTVSTVIIRDIGLDCVDDPTREGRFDMLIDFEKRRTAVDAKPIAHDLRGVRTYFINTDGVNDNQLVTMIDSETGCGVRFEGEHAISLIHQMSDYDVRNGRGRLSDRHWRDFMTGDDVPCVYPPHFKKLVSVPNNRGSMIYDRARIARLLANLQRCPAMWLPSMYRIMMDVGAYDTEANIKTIVTETAIWHLRRLAAEPTDSVVEEVVDALRGLLISIDRTFSTSKQAYMVVAGKRSNPVDRAPPVHAINWAAGSVIRAIRGASPELSVQGTYLPDNSELSPEDRVDNYVFGQFIVVCLEPRTDAMHKQQHIFTCLDTSSSAPLSCGSPDGHYFIEVRAAYGLPTSARIINGVAVRVTANAEDAVCIGIGNGTAVVYRFAQFARFLEQCYGARIDTRYLGQESKLATYGLWAFMKASSIELAGYERDVFAMTMNDLASACGEPFCHSRTLVDIYYHSPFLPMFSGRTAVICCNFFTSVFHFYINRMYSPDYPSERYLERACLLILIISRCQKDVLATEGEGVSIPVLFKQTNQFDWYSAGYGSMHCSTLAQYAHGVGAKPFGCGQTGSLTESASMRATYARLWQKSTRAGRRGI